MLEHNDVGPEPFPHPGPGLLHRRRRVIGGSEIRLIVLCVHSMNLCPAHRPWLGEQPWVPVREKAGRRPRRTQTGEPPSSFYGFKVSTRPLAAWPTTGL